MKHILIALIFITTLAFAQTTQSIDDIDKIYLAFNAEPFDLPDWSTYIAKFTAIKFWYISGSQVPILNNPLCYTLKLGITLMAHNIIRWSVYRLTVHL